MKGEEVKVVMLEVDPELPLAIARTQAASALELDSDPLFIFKGRVLTPTQDDQPFSEVGVREGDFVVAVLRSPLVPSRQAGQAKAPKIEPAGPRASTVVANCDDDLARQLQADEDERAARRVQDDLDGDLARQEQARQAFGDARASEIASTQRLVHVRGDLPNAAPGAALSWIPLMVDTGAQFSVLTHGLAERLGLLGGLDRTAAGVAGGVGHANVLGKLRGVPVRFGELELAVDFAVLDGAQMPTANIAILGLDQLAVHHMVVDFDARVLRVGGCEGYVVRMLENYEVPEEFHMDRAAAQKCVLQ